MANEVINVEGNDVVTEVTNKIEFTSGEKTALIAVGCGIALMGYGVGSFVIEPLAKKAITAIGSGIKKLNKKPEKTPVVVHEVDLKPEAPIAKLAEEKETEG